VVSIVTTLQAGRSGVQISAGSRDIFFLFSKMPRLALGPAQPPIQWVVYFLNFLFFFFVGGGGKADGA
jgi:hypothetical protein